MSNLKFIGGTVFLILIWALVIFLFLYSVCRNEVVVEPERGHLVFSVFVEEIAGCRTSAQVAVCTNKQVGRYIEWEGVVWEVELLKGEGWEKYIVCVEVDAPDYSSKLLGEGFVYTAGSLLVITDDAEALNIVPGDKVIAGGVIKDVDITGVGLFEGKVAFVGVRVVGSVIVQN